MSTSTAVARRDAVAEVVATIDRPEYQAQLAEMLPPEVSLAKFTRTAKHAIQVQPDLVNADKQSLYLALVRCAASGLLPDNRESALVVVKARGKEKIQWWPMIGGLRKKAAEHGITLAASVVYANDSFSYSTMPPAVEHAPTPLGHDRGQPIGAFAVALDAHTSRVICPPVVMDVAEIEKVRATSRTSGSEYSPWVRWWDRMACKTVARRLFSEMPLAARAREELVDRVVDAGAVEESVAEVPALANLPTVDPSEEWEETEGEVVEELEGEPDDGTSSVSGASDAVVGSVQTHAPEPSPSDGSLFTDMARQHGLVE